MFESPVMPATPTKAPAHARRGEAVKRRLDWHAAQTPQNASAQPVAAGTQQNTRAATTLTAQSMSVGTFVTSPAANRKDDTGVIMAVTGTECEVLSLG